MFLRLSEPSWGMVGSYCQAPMEESSRGLSVLSSPPDQAGSLQAILWWPIFTRKCHRVLMALGFVAENGLSRTEKALANFCRKCSTL